MNTIVLQSGEYYQIYTDAGAFGDWQGVVHSVGAVMPGTHGFSADAATQHKLNMIARTLGGLVMRATDSDPPDRLDGTLQLNVDAMSSATTDFTLASPLVRGTRLITASAAVLQVGSHGPTALSHAVRIKAADPDSTAYVAQMLIEGIGPAGMFTGTYVIDPADPLCTFSGTLADPIEVAGVRALRITFGAGCAVTPEGETWDGVAIILVDDAHHMTMRATVLAPDQSRAVLFEGSLGYAA